MDRLVELSLRFAVRHERVLAIIGALWFALGCASAAGFVDLPQIPFVTDTFGWLCAAVWNALWWGAAHPALERRRAKDAASPPD